MESRQGILKKKRLEKREFEKQNLWVVTELYYPEMTSTGYYLTEIAEGLTDSFEVKVLCGQPNYSARGVRAPSRERHKDVEIFRAFGTTLDKNIIPFRIINMISLSVSVFFHALFKFRRGDEILVVTTPPSLPFAVALAACLKNAGYTLLIHDNYPEILIAAGKTEAESFLVKILNSANGWLYRGAKKIIVVGHDMRDLVGKKLTKIKKRGEIPVEIIPNWAELEQVEPMERKNNQLLEELGIQDKFVFLYAGNMGHPNDLESFIFCAEKLKEDNRFHFVFLGAGVKRKWLEETIEKKKLNNVTLLKPRPRSEQKNFLNACDVALVSLVKKMWGVSMPSRTYNILAAGKPILALTERNSELARVISEEKVGWVLPPDEPETLLEKIYEIFEERETLFEKGILARNAAQEKYSKTKAINSYKKCLLNNASDNEKI